MDVKNLVGVQNLKCGIVNKYNQEIEAASYGLDCYTGEDNEEDNSELERAYIWLSEAYLNGCPLEDKFICEIQLYLNKKNLNTECETENNSCDTLKMKKLKIVEKTSSEPCVKRCLKIYDKL